MDMITNAISEAEKSFIHSLQEHPFLRRCRDGSVSLWQLKIFLVQQGLYSRHFTRYLCAMMSNLSQNEQVLSLAENLFDELGFSELSDIPHSVIYRDMLSRFGLDLTSETKQLPGTTLLIDSMFTHCRDLNPARGLGALCLGAEAMVPTIYTDILSGFTSQGVNPEHMEFFSLHIQCDDGHAETMRQIMLKTAAHDICQLEIILQSGRDLLNARLAFFDDIEAAKLNDAIPIRNMHQHETGVTA